MDNRELIARAKAAAEGVTQGPWEFHEAEDEWAGWTISAPSNPDLMCNMKYYPWHSENERDARFIAATRELVPQLADALEAAEAALAEERDEGMWRFWSAKAETLARKNAELKAALAKVRSAFEHINCIGMLDAPPSHDAVTARNIARQALASIGIPEPDPVGEGLLCHYDNGDKVFLSSWSGGAARGGEWARLSLRKETRHGNYSREYQAVTDWQVAPTLAQSAWEPGIECEHGYDACPICDSALAQKEPRDD